MDHRDEPQSKRHATIEQITLSLLIAAPRATVWAALTQEVASWWPADYRATVDAKAFHFEAHPGGRVWEETEGGGLQWFTVQALEAEAWVNLAGFTGPPWGGPSVTTLRIELHDTEEGHTRLEVVDASFGRIASRTDVESGWQAIFEGLQKLLADRGQ